MLKGIVYGARVSATGSIVAGKRPQQRTLSISKFTPASSSQYPRQQRYVSGIRLNAASTVPDSEVDVDEQLALELAKQKSEALHRRKQRAQAKVKEQRNYQLAAVAATTLVISIAAFSTYYRFAWHLHQGEPFPTAELGFTLLLVFGGMVGMEMYARWAHRVVWHDGPGWILHKSHHEPRVGPFEANDIYAIMNAVPAIALCLYGFLRPDMIGGLCYGTGLGITLFGISYMFVHDGLIHKRFNVGPIAELPALKRISIAHRIHHQDKYAGVPFGLFLGPQELAAVGGEAELERQVALELEN